MAVGRRFGSRPASKTQIGTRDAEITARASDRHHDNRMDTLLKCLLLGGFCFGLGDNLLANPDQIRGFVSENCLDCHEGDSAEAGLDVAKLAAGLEDPSLFEKWVQVYDRVAAGEMPPPDSSDLTDRQREAFLKTTGTWLAETARETNQKLGRVRGRRLTKLQLERTLHDLLGIDIPLATTLPDDPRSHGFTTVASGQQISHFQLEQHLTVVDAALEEAFRRALTPADEWKRNLNARTLSRRRPRSRTREPELVDGKAITWSSRLIFYGRLPATTARQDGWYRFRIRAHSLKQPEKHGVWCTVRSGQCVSSAPLLGWVGAFEATEKTQEWTFEAWLPKGHMLEIRPGDATLKLARFRGGQVGTGEGDPQNVPGVAIESLEMARIHLGADDQEIARILFGDLELVRDRGQTKLRSKNPKRDAARLLQRFARRAFRRPVDESHIADYVALVHQSLDNGEGMEKALRAGYRALLCSPRFSHFYETPGALDDYAIASRLSYFLWNSMPDERLNQLASQSKLRDHQVIRAEVERMLNAPRGRHFVKDFAAEWLDLSLIEFTEPDRRLYPSFDVIVQNAMLNETHAFLHCMLNENLSVGKLIDSDFTFLDSRLARFYDIERIRGDDLQRVVLKPEDRRGGVLTHGAVLKVTANGTTTSPVIRGVWVSERLLGVPIPPPPEGVPAIEPDIRGAKTIRDMLAKHRSNDSCASCHTKIDPPGFALENFDPAGRWRDRYGKLGRRRIRGPEIDASYDLADGRHFDNLNQFKELILADPEQLAHNVAEKMLTYGTGAPIGFADRDELKRAVHRAESTDYGMRSLLVECVCSEIFLTK